MSQDTDDLADPVIVVALDSIAECHERLAAARTAGDYSMVCFQLGGISAGISVIYNRNIELDQEDADAAQ